MSTKNQKNRLETLKEITDLISDINNTRSFYNSKIGRLKNKKTLLNTKDHMLSIWTPFINHESQLQIKDIEKIDAEIKKLKAERDIKISAKKQELSKLKNVYRNKGKDASNSKTKFDIRHPEKEFWFWPVALITLPLWFFLWPIVLIYILFRILSSPHVKSFLSKHKKPLTIGITMLIVLIIINIVFSAINKSIEESRDYFIIIDSDFTFDCEASLSDLGKIACKERKISGNVSNYPSTHISGIDDLNGNDFTIKTSTNIPETLYKTDDFDINAINREIHTEKEVTIFNTILSKFMANKTIDIHFTLSDNDIALISKEHDKWLENKKIEEEQRQEREVKAKAEEEARKAEEEAKEQKEAAEKAEAEERARQEAERKAKEEAERKAAEEEAKKSYKIKSIKDGENCPSNAKTCYIYDGGTGNAEWGYGHINGRLINNTGRDLSYVSISFGLYNANGAKISDCYDNLSGLKTGGTWAFEAYCFAWERGVTVNDIDVTYW